MSAAAPALAGCAKARQRELSERAMETFRLFDTNKDGCIDRGELRMVLQELDECWTYRRCEHLFKALDFNGDDRIQFEEFVRWCFATTGEEQLDFRYTMGLDDLSLPFVVVTVRGADGEIVLGPEEIDGALSVGGLRRRVSKETEVPVGCICSGECIMRDSMELGVYADREHKSLDLTAVDDAFTMLHPECLSELRALGAISDELGQQSMRLGRGGPLRRAENGELGRGEEQSELLLQSDGTLLAKSFSYWGLAKASQTFRTWNYEIAEGYFSILDPDTCFVELYWRRWAKRKATDRDTGGPPSADVLGDWEELEVDEVSQPNHLTPSTAGRINVRRMALDSLEGYSSRDYIGNPQADPLAGVPMPGIDRVVLSNLGLSQDHESYWTHGKKRTGPVGSDGVAVW